MQKKFYSVLLLLTLLLTPLLAVSKPIHQRAKVWSGVLFTGPLSKNISYQLFAEGRWFNERSLYHQSIFFSNLGFALSPTVRFWVGYALFNFLNLSTNKVGTEHRLLQQFTWNTITKPSFNLELRSRIEERIRVNRSGVAARWRDAIRLRFTKAIANCITPVIADELFFNLNKVSWSSNRFLGQNRFFIGFEIPTSHSSTFIFGYLNQYFFRRQRNIMNHIFYLSLRVRT